MSQSKHLQTGKDRLHNVSMHYNGVFRGAARLQGEQVAVLVTLQWCPVQVDLLIFNLQDKMSQAVSSF